MRTYTSEDILLLNSFIEPLKFTLCYVATLKHYYINHDYLYGGYYDYTDKSIFILEIGVKLGSYKRADVHYWQVSYILLIIFLYRYTQEILW